MPIVRKTLPGGVWPPGGSISRLQEKVYQEAAYIAYHFHWSRGDVMSMSRRETRRWIGEIANINKAINATKEEREAEEAGR